MTIDQRSGHGSAPTARAESVRSSVPDGHKLWPHWLRKIDTLLEDEGVIDVVTHALEARWPQSRRRGRLGTPAEVVMRTYLKHVRLHRCSDAQL